MIISHRLRGFDIHDATLSGLQKALNLGILGIETDTRQTQDGVIVLNHDAHLQEHFNSRELIANIHYDRLKTIPHKYKTSSILTLSRLLLEMEESPNKACTLFLDVKESGYESEIVTLLDKHCMLNRTVIVSWLPEVLQKFHYFGTPLPLCFSHYKVTGAISARFLSGIVLVKEILSGKPKITNIAYEKYNDIPHYINNFSPGMDYEHIVKNYVAGKLLDMLAESGGMVCSHFNSINNADVAYYGSHGIKTMVYSIDNIVLLQNYTETVRPDFILTNNADLCSYS
ncbi:MAG: hypothetical protein HYV28_21535 [Ignavibacteriales bacterium]|nr:hypothetical protein [Ignavibacteriales bacterium]